MQAQADAGLSAEAQARADTQIAAVLKDKAARTPAQKKLDSQFIYAAREAATGKAIDGLPQFHSNVRIETGSRVEVDIKGKITPALLAAIAAQGGKIVDSHPEADMVRVTLPLVGLETIAARPEVRFIARPPKMTVHTGSVDAQSDQTQLAASARTTYGVTGAGVSIGVMSDSADDGKGALAAAYASGDLDKNNTVILSGQAGTGSGEGGAMMQIVHDIAPGAKIYFATANPTAEQFAANIRALKAAGCKVIVDDITYGNESPFQDQVISQAVAEVCSQGVLYFSSNGNGGNKEQNSSTIWEGDYKDGGVVPDAYGEGTGARFHEFTPTTGSVTKNNKVLGDGSGTLFWSDPLGGSSNDYDLFEVNAAGTLVNFSTNTQDGTQDPYESFEGTKAGDSLEIVQLSGAAARFLHLEAGEPSPLTINTNGNLRGHNGPSVATGMFSVSAAPCAASGGTNPDGPYPNAFSSTDRTESFSSDGPRRMFYTANGTAFTPGNVSSTGGKVFAHPDITGGDGVSTTTAHFTPFYGTSAAAPDVAAVAALLLSKYPNLTQAQADAAMRAGVVKINETPATAGAGIVLATKVLAAAVTEAPVITSAKTISGKVGTAFSYQITASNNPTSYGVQGLPGGLTVNGTTGLISGKPTKAGTYSLTLNAYNSAGKGSATLTLTVTNTEPPVITSAATASGKVGVAFSYQIVASNSPTTYGVQGLPSGLAVSSSTGLISGTPTVAGTFMLTLNAYNATGKGSKTLTLTISGPPVITSAKSASGMTGRDFTYQITATNDPTSFGVQGIPAGLSVNGTTGVLSGRPENPGTYTLTVNAYNAAGKGSATVTLTVTQS